MAASTSFVCSASQCSGVADYLGECTGSQVTTLALYGQSESSTCVYCGLLNAQGNVLVVAIVCNNGCWLITPWAEHVHSLHTVQDLLIHAGECT